MRVTPAAIRRQMRSSNYVKRLGLAMTTGPSHIFRYFLLNTCIERAFELTYKGLCTMLLSHLEGDSTTNALLEVRV